MDWFRKFEQDGQGNRMMVLTAKGYPDHATRNFLHMLSFNVPHIRLFYIGDADPYGAEIFFTYMFGSVRSQVIQQKTSCQTLNKLEWIGPFMQDFSPSEPQDETEEMRNFKKS